MLPEQHRSMKINSAFHFARIEGVKHFHKDINGKGWRINILNKFKGLVTCQSPNLLR